MRNISRVSQETFSLKYLPLIYTITKVEVKNEITVSYIHQITFREKLCFVKSISPDIYIYVYIYIYNSKFKYLEKNFSIYLR